MLRHAIFFPPSSFCIFQVVSYVVLLSHITYKFIISSSCNLVHGGWSKWSGWTSCSQTCGTGFQVRSRSCTNPKPKHGGRLCTGLKSNKRICRRQRCPGKNKCSFTEWKHCLILSWKVLFMILYLFLYSLEIGRGKNPLHTIFFPPRSFCNF